MCRPAIALLAAACLAASARADVPTLADLRVEQRVAHLGVDPAQPRFSWQLVDDERGARQSAYRVLVASDEALLDQDVGDLWDSGQVPSAEQHLVPYAGSALAGAERYWWKVRIWDEDGLASAWSATSTFDTAPSTGWAASFLWDSTTGDNDTVYLRKAFELPAAAALGKVFVTAHDEYALWVNGTLVGRGPAPADPCDSMRVVAYDVTSLLVVGENVLAARAHWDGGPGYAGVTGEGVFALQAELDRVDGVRQRVVTDGTWRVLEDTPYDETAPVRGPDFAGASTVEDYDARLEPVGWRLAGFDDSGWDPATIRTPPYRLVAQEVPALVELEQVPPISTRRLADGTVLVDFGRNLTGWIALRLDDQVAGRRVTAHYSEELSGGRIVRDRDRITDMWDAYTTVAGNQTWTPDIDVLGFRYVELEGLSGPLAPSKIRLVRAGTGLEPATTFTSSSTTLDDVLRISRETIEACAQGVLVDCPTREQTQFMMDAYVQGHVLGLNYRESNLLAKAVRDLHESDVGGAILSGRHPSETVVLLAEWLLSWVLALDHVWWTSGDLRLVEHCYATVEGLLDRFATYVDGSTGLILTLPAGTYPFLGVDKTEPGLVTLNSIYVGALRAAVRLADAVGDEDRAAQWSADADALAAAVHANLFDGVDAYWNAVGSNSQVQLGSALPLLFDVVPAADRDRVARRVRDWGFEVETIGGYFLSRTLIALDLGDQLVAAYEDPSRHWGAILAQGGTTTWESWEPTYSLAHAWSAYPLGMVVEGTVGLSPAAPGWAEIEYRPRLAASLDHAEATVVTPRGEAHLRWDEDPQGARRLILTVPPNTTGHLSIPVHGFASWGIYEGTTPVFTGGSFNESIPDLELDGLERDYLRLRAEPGHYCLDVRGIRLDVGSAGSPPGAVNRR